MNLHKRILDNLSNAVLVLDRDLSVSYINPAGEMLLGVSARQARGQQACELLHLEARLDESLRIARDGGHPFTEREVEMSLRPELVVTVDFSVTPFLDATRDAALLLELQHLDRHIRISREEHLLAQQHATRALIRGLAHEVKNPLGGLRGAAQLLERRLDDDELREYTQVIIGEADRLQVLVDRMLGPAKLPRHEMLNIHEVLERVRQLVEAESSITIDADYDPSIPGLVADRDQLIQALLNIIRNAVQSIGEEGHVAVRSRCHRQFTIGQQRHRLVIGIDVVDDGPGIPAEMIENIFYPMVSGRAGGSGLGLSIAQELIHRHGGLIECKSRPGQTVFRILLPLEGELNEEA
ncbi:MAG: nitrogen regulation protein NR(II) [Gammaproteobacteria bacterium]|nr:nitrogen regulation protein NR(II) [Gammaproteobacteria bacterium]